MSSPKNRGNYLLQIGKNGRNYLSKKITNARGYLSKKITNARGYLSKKPTSNNLQLNSKKMCQLDHVGNTYLNILNESLKTSNILIKDSNKILIKDLNKILMLAVKNGSVQRYSHIETHGLQLLNYQLIGGFEVADFNIIQDGWGNPEKILLD